MRDAELLGLSIEIQCQLAFTQLNIVLSKPITQDSKYDFIADINNKLLKIQCKSCIAESDESAITFHTCSCGRGAGGKNYSHTYSADDVDYFYTYYKGKSYLDICRVFMTDEMAEGFYHLKLGEDSMWETIKVGIKEGIPLKDGLPPSALSIIGIGLSINGIFFIPIGAIIDSFIEFFFFRIFIRCLQFHIFFYK